MDYVSNGATIAGCLKGTERYTGRIVYENARAKTVGQISVTANITAGFNTYISSNLGTAALNMAMGETPSHDSSEDGFSVQIKCNHTNREKYTVSVNCNSITVPTTKPMQLLPLSRPELTVTPAVFSHNLHSFFQQRRENELEICCFRKFVPGSRRSDRCC